MIDFARITVKAGDGGRGSGSSKQIRGKRYGRADGGDGGRGGHVYIEATGDLNTLEPFRYVKEYKAQNGGGGLSQNRKGAEGEDLIIKVPMGTEVKVTNKSNGSNKSYETYELLAVGQKILITRGGEGGRGNAHLRDEFGRRPRTGEVGQEGEIFNLTLELKLIADIGLIGLPNAGKSTLLASLTSAKPAIANYPFTTLEPNLGVLLEVGRSLGTWDSRNKKPTDLQSYNPKNLILADIPGLIEGASLGRGLGDLFLRHIERTKILVHLVDISGEGEKWKDYQKVRAELKNYSGELLKKREIVVLTKIDLVNKETISYWLKIFASHRKKAIAVSALGKIGLDNLVKLM